MQCDLKTLQAVLADRNKVTEQEPRPSPVPRRSEQERRRSPAPRQAAVASSRFEEESDVDQAFRMCCSILGQILCAGAKLFLAWLWAVLKWAARGVWACWADRIKFLGFWASVVGMYFLCKELCKWEVCDTCCTVAKAVDGAMMVGGGFYVAQKVADLLSCARSLNPESGGAGQSKQEARPEQDAKASDSCDDGCMVKCCEEFSKQLSPEQMEQIEQAISQKVSQSQDATVAMTAGMLQEKLGLLNKLADAYEQIRPERLDQLRDSIWQQIMQSEEKTVAKTASMLQDSEAAVGKRLDELKYLSPEEVEQQMQALRQQIMQSEENTAVKTTRMLHESASAQDSKYKLYLCGLVGLVAMLFAMPGYLAHQLRKLNTRVDTVEKKLLTPSHDLVEPRKALEQKVEGYSKQVRDLQSEVKQLANTVKALTRMVMAKDQVARKAAARGKGPVLADGVQC